MKTRNFFAKAETRIRPQVIPDKRRAAQEAWDTMAMGSEWLDHDGVKGYPQGVSYSQGPFIVKETHPTSDGAS